MSYFKDENPLVTVIMPAYNAEKYIEKAISSVISQSYENWELLVIDDGSTDSTVEIVERNFGNEPRIHFYKNEKNIGVAKTRNRGFDLANGEWIALLDSDDIWMPDKTEKQLKLLDSCKADILYSSYTLFYDEDCKDKKLYKVPGKTSYNKMLGENVIGCSTVMINKKILSEHRFNDKYYHEDYALWLDLLKTGCTAAGCTESLVDYRVVKNSRSFDKKNAALNRWLIYRDSQRLPLYKAIPAFCVYMINGVIKHG